MTVIDPGELSGGGAPVPGEASQGQSPATGAPAAPLSGAALI